jgi:hypothetical protein
VSGHLARMQLRMRELQSRTPAVAQRPSPAALPVDNAPPPVPLLLRPSDAAKLCGISEATLRKWPVPRFKYGNVQGYRPEDLRRFISERMLNCSSNHQEREPDGQSEH